jgi:hypothetical protein
LCLELLDRMQPPKAIGSNAHALGWKCRK